MDKKVLTMVASENHNPSEFTNENQEFIRGNSSNLKKCPFCAELIQAEAVKCKHCGEFLDGSGRSSFKPASKKWYYSTPSVVIALICFGVMVIPFVWKNPEYKTSTKVIISVIALAYTVYCVYLIISVYLGVFKQIEEMGL